MAGKRRNASRSASSSKRRALPLGAELAETDPLADRYPNPNSCRPKLPGVAVPLPYLEDRRVMVNEVQNLIQLNAVQTGITVRHIRPEDNYMILIYRWSRMKPEDVLAELRSNVSDREEAARMHPKLAGMLARPPGGRLFTPHEYAAKRKNVWRAHRLDLGDERAAFDASEHDENDVFDDRHLPLAKMIVSARNRWESMLKAAVPLTAAEAARPDSLKKILRQEVMARRVNYIKEMAHLLCAKLLHAPAVDRDDQGPIFAPISQSGGLSKGAAAELLCGPAISHEFVNQLLVAGLWWEQHTYVALTAVSASRAADSARRIWKACGIAMWKAWGDKKNLWYPDMMRQPGQEKDRFNTCWEARELSRVIKSHENNVAEIDLVCAGPREREGGFPDHAFITKTPMAGFTLLSHCVFDIATLNSGKRYKAAVMKLASNDTHAKFPLEPLANRLGFIPMVEANADGKLNKRHSLWMMYGKEDKAGEEVFTAYDDADNGKKDFRYCVLVEPPADVEAPGMLDWLRSALENSVAPPGASEGLTNVIRTYCPPAASGIQRCF